MEEDISLVEFTSSKYITYMARPMMTEFAGGRDLKGDGREAPTVAT